MKKLIFIFLTFMLILTGCGKYGEKDVLRDLNKKISNLKSYYIEGKMEIINNEDIYKYDVKVSYKEKDNYKVSLKNESNNHEQIILKNSDGVYVLTPSLNKSFKFESDWPYKNSQIYLLQSLLNDINNDKDIEFESNNEKYKITTTVDYPNNRALVKQNIYLDTKLNVKEVQVLNNEDVAEIKMTFETIDQNPSFNDDYFSLKQNMETTIIDEEVNEVLEIDDTVFPMYLPENTSLEDVKSKLNSVDSYADIQKIVNDEVPYIGLYRNKNILILNANVGGNFSPNSYNVYYNFNEWFRQK